MSNIKSPGLRRPFRGVRGVVVVPSLRRPASRCRGSWRPPAGAQLHLHTCVKGSAQAVKQDVCRCAASKKKVISSHTVSTKVVSQTVQSQTELFKKLTTSREFDETD